MSHIIAGEKISSKTDLEILKEIEKIRGYSQSDTRNG
jgi:hypothetical protein